MVSPPAPEGAGLVTIALEALSAAELSTRLEREWGVCARPGLHCAPEAHRLVGTLETGALRFSLGWASTTEDVDRAVEGTERVLASLTSPAVPGGLA